MHFDHHKPVLCKEIIDYLQPLMGGLYLDATLGAGGHSEAILSYPNAKVIGLDLDPTALEIAIARLSVFGSRFRAINGNFSDLSTIQIQENLTGQDFDGILVDLGISSMQIDQAKRGFSFQKDGPLDMRMNQKQTLSASDVVNHSSQEEIANILWQLGEERLSKRIARKIVQQRQKETICTTAQLADLVLNIYPKSQVRRQKIHPATRTFQALRIFVNSELENLRRFLAIGFKLLKPGGRLCIVSFHSLEDRLVKHSFRHLASQCICPPRTPICCCQHQPEIKILTKRPITPSHKEVATNRRSRSAKLRIALRI